MTPPAASRRILLPILAAGLCLAAAGCAGDSTEKELREIEESYRALRDAILQGDDEAFFRMHSAASREHAVRDFPIHRSRYLALPDEGKKSFLADARMTAEEFLGGDPQVLAVRLLPWESGWRERREMFRAAKVKDVRIERVTLPGGVLERRGVVVLDISGYTSPGTAVPESHLPTVVFVKDPEGWRRRSFFME